MWVGKICHFIWIRLDFIQIKWQILPTHIHHTVRRVAQQHRDRNVTSSYYTLSQQIWCWYVTVVQNFCKFRWILCYLIGLHCTSAICNDTWSGSWWDSIFSVPCPLLLYWCLSFVYLLSLNKQLLCTVHYWCTMENMSSMIIDTVLHLRVVIPPFCQCNIKSCVIDYTVLVAFSALTL